MNMRKQAGFNLIELLVALAIGGFLIIGAITLQTNTRKTFTVNEQQARLQETARYVISVIEPEIRLAGMWGFSNKSETVLLRSGGTDSAPSLMKQTAIPVPAPPIVHRCGNNFVTDVYQAVQAINNGYTLNAANCPALGGGHNGVSDTIVVRRSSSEPTDPSATKMQVYTNRRLFMGGQVIFNGAAAPGPFNRLDLDNENTYQVRDWVTNVYYIANNADSRPGMPALRAKILTTDGAAPWFDDQEVIRGVEDIQVEFGIDTGGDRDMDGAPDMDNGMALYVNGNVTRYVPPTSPLVLQGQVVAVRLWVRVRAEDAEQGFVNNRRYQYGSTDITPNDRFRRVLMSRTIYLRNARQWGTSVRRPSL